MPRIGIQYDDAKIAIDTIIANGAEPSVQRIREILGTGSPNTIHRHLKKWRETAPVLVRKAAEVSPQFASLLDDLKAVAAKDQERAKAAESAELESQLLAAGQTADELSELGEALEADNEQLTEANRELAEANGQLQTQVRERDAQITKLTGDLDQERSTANELRTQLAEARIRLASADELVGDLKSSCAVAEAARINAERDLAVATERGSGLAERISGLAEQIADYKAQAKAHVADAQILRGECGKAVDKANAASLDLSEAKGEIKALKFANANLTAQNEKLLATMEQIENEDDQRRSDYTQSH